MLHHWSAACLGIVTLTACRSPTEPTTNLAAALRVTVTDVRVVQGGTVTRPLRGLSLGVRLENTARDSLDFSECGISLAFFDVASSQWQSASGGCGWDESLQWRTLAPGKAVERQRLYLASSGVFPFQWPVGGLTGNVSGTYRVDVKVRGGRVGHALYAYSDPFVVVDTAGR